MFQSKKVLSKIHKKSYFICTTHRSGSSLLCDLLIRTGVAGNPAEYFYTGFFPELFKRFESNNFAEYLPKVVAANVTPNGTFGVKLMGGAYFDDFVEQVRSLPAYHDQSVTRSEMLADCFPNLHYIWLSRRNKVRQAVSFLRATHSGVWRSDRPPRPGKGQPFTNDIESISHQVSSLSLQEALWQEYFDEAGIRPLTLVYEDFIQWFDETVKELLDYLEISVPTNWSLTEIRQKKLADVTSNSMVQQYYDAAKRSRYSLTASSGEEIARQVSIRQIIKAVAFKIANQPGLGWLYGLRGLVKRLLGN